MVLDAVLPLTQSYYRCYFASFCFLIISRAKVFKQKRDVILIRKNIPTCSVGYKKGLDATVSSAILHRVVNPRLASTIL